MRISLNRFAERMGGYRIMPNRSSKPNAVLKTADRSPDDDVGFEDSVRLGGTEHTVRRSFRRVLLGAADAGPTDLGRAGRLGPGEDGLSALKISNDGFNPLGSTLSHRGSESPNCTPESRIPRWLNPMP